MPGSRFEPVRLEDAAAEQDALEVRGRDVVAEGGDVDRAQLGQCEDLRREREAHVRVRELGPQSPKAVVDDLAVIEGGRGKCFHRVPGRVRGRLGVDVDRDEAEVCGRELPALRVAPRVAPRLQLLQMGELADVHLRGQVAADRLLERLARLEETTRQRPAARERIAGALPHQGLQRISAHLEDDGKADVERGGSGRLSHQV